MDRREVLKHGAALACVATLPEVFAIPANSLTAVAWTETKLTAAHLAVIEPLLKKLIAGKALTSLAAAEWNALATSHHMYLTLHGDAGDLANVDTAIRANQAYLKTRFNSGAVDYVVAHSSYELLSHMSGHLITCRDKVAGGSLAPPPGILVPNLSCAFFWIFSAAVWGMFGLLVPELAIPFYLMGIGTDVFGAFSCD